MAIGGSFALSRGSSYAFVGMLLGLAHVAESLIGAWFESVDRVFRPADIQCDDVLYLRLLEHVGHGRSQRRERAVQHKPLQGLTGVPTTACQCTEDAIPVKPESHELDNLLQLCPR